MLANSNVIVCLLAALVLHVMGDSSFEMPNNNQDLIGALHRGDVDQLGNSIDEIPSTRHYNLLLNATSNWTLLHEIASQGLADVVLKLAETGTFDLTPISDEGDTPLHIAVRHGQVETVDAFIKVANTRGQLANLLEAQNPKTGNTPIFEAAAKETNDSMARERLKCAVKLHDSGASLDGHENADGNYPIHFAMLNDRLDFVKMALFKVVSLQKQPAGLKNNRKTISHVAAETNSLKFLEEMRDWFDPAALDSHGQSPACYAVANGHYKFAKVMINNGLSDSLLASAPICHYNLEHHPHLSGSPLHVAAMHRRYGLVALLVNNGADTKARDSSNGTVFHAMAMVTDAEEVRTVDLSEIYDDDAELDAEPKEDQVEIKVRFELTPVLTKIPDRVVDHRLITDFLGSDISFLESTDANGRTPFLTSVSFGAEEFSKLLQTEFAVSSSSVDDLGYSALHLANDGRQLHALLSLGENVFPSGIDTQSFPGRNEVPGLMTPLMVAVAQNKSIKLIEYLINVVKANVSLRNDHNQSLAHLAVFANCKAFIERRVDLLDFRSKDKRGMSAVHLAVENRNLDILKVIVSAKADPNSTKSMLEEATPLLLAMSNSLHLAVVFQQLEIIDYLMDVHPDLIESKDALGRTPAHLAVTCENPTILPFVLDKLDDPSQATSIQDNYGRTPLMLAVEQGCVSLAELLLTKYNSSCSQANVDSLTVLDQARKLANWRMVNALIATGRCGSVPKVQCDLLPRGESFALGKMATPDSPVLPPEAKVSLGASVSLRNSNRYRNSTFTCLADAGQSLGYLSRSHFQTFEDVNNSCRPSARTCCCSSPGGDNLDGKFVLISGSFTFDQAKQRCKSAGLLMATICTLQEYEKAQQIGNNLDAWIGLMRDETTCPATKFKWVETGRCLCGVAEAFWHTGQPDILPRVENCGHFWKRIGRYRWNDNSCGYKINVICQRS